MAELEPYDWDGPCSEPIMFTTVIHAWRKGTAETLIGQVTGEFNPKEPRTYEEFSEGLRKHLQEQLAEQRGGDWIVWFECECGTSKDPIGGAVLARVQQAYKSQPGTN